MNDIDNTIEAVNRFNHFIDIVHSPEEYFKHMQGHTKELSLVLSAFTLSEHTQDITSALEKQIPQKPIGAVANLQNRYCPSCHEWMIFEKIGKVNYCPTCGQALAWE